MARRNYTKHNDYIGGFFFLVFWLAMIGLILWLIIGCVGAFIPQKSSVATPAPVRLSVEAGSNNGSHSSRRGASRPTPYVPPGTTFVINKKSKKFHRITCHSINDMSESNKVFSKDTREEIIKKGYKPCGNCSP